MSWKTFLLFRFKILGLFFNTLTADDKYSHHNKGNLPQPMQMEIFIVRFKFTETFEHFEEKYEPHSLIFSEIIPSEKRGYLNA